MKTSEYLLLLLSLVVLSCKTEILPDRPPEDGAYRIRFGAPPVKSALEGADDRLYRISAAVYEQGGGRCFAMEDLVLSASGPSLLLEAGTRYDFFVLANGLAGRLRFPEEESRLLALLDTLSAVDPDRTGSVCTSLSENTGLPMRCVQRGLTPREADLLDGQSDGIITLSLEQFFARVKLQIDSTACAPYSVTIEEVSAHQCNRNLTLLGSPGSARAQNGGDLVEGDRETLPDGDGTYRLYLPENAQGILLPENVDSWRKTPEGLTAAGQAEKAGLCTYIQVRCRVQSDIGVRGEAVFRFYPGHDACGDFNILRGDDLHIILTLSREGLRLTGSWKVDGTSIRDSRRLWFPKRRCLLPSGGSVDFQTLYHMTAKNGMIQETDAYGQSYGWHFVLPDSLAAKLAIRPYADSYQRFSLRDRNGLRPGIIFQLRAESFDGLIQDDMEVEVVPNGTFRAGWLGTEPHYIAQSGILSAESLPQRVERISYSLTAGNGVLQISDQGDGSCRIALTDEGCDTLSVTAWFDAHPYPLARIPFRAAAPRACAGKTVFEPDLGGAACALEGFYTDSSGTVLGPETFDPVLYAALLKMKWRLNDGAWSPYLRLEGSSLRVIRLRQSQEDIRDLCGALFSGALTLSAPSAAVQPVQVPILLHAPFETWPDIHLLLHDYLALTDSQNPPGEKTLPHALLDDVSVVRIETLPEDACSDRQESFSFGLSRTQDGDALRWNGFMGKRHASGPVRLRARVGNRHCRDTVTWDVGQAEIYLHQAIGLKPAGGETSNGDLMCRGRFTPCCGGCWESHPLVREMTERLGGCAGFFSLQNLPTGWQNDLSSKPDYRAYIRYAYEVLAPYIGRNALAVTAESFPSRDDDRDAKPLTDREYENYCPAAAIHLDFSKTGTWFGQDPETGWQHYAGGARDASGRGYLILHTRHAVTGKDLDDNP